MNKGKTDKPISTMSAEEAFKDYKEKYLDLSNKQECIQSEYDFKKGFEYASSPLEATIAEQAKRIKHLEERYAKAEKANDMLNLTIKMMSERASTKEEQLGKEIEELRKALTEISEGKGRYNTDPFTHARNTIEDMVQLATEALSKG